MSKPKILSLERPGKPECTLGKSFAVTTGMCDVRELTAGKPKILKPLPVVMPPKPMLAGHAALWPAATRNQQRHVFIHAEITTNESSIGERQ